MGHRLGLYDSWIWFDLAPHFLGGVVVAAGIIWAFSRAGIMTEAIFTQNGLLAVLLLTLFIGLLWEIFEYVGGAPQEKLYVLDTTVDMIMDGLGAYAIWLGFTRTLPRLSAVQMNTRSNRR
jgi:hypothetical protein